MDFTVLHADAHLLVLDKPAGLLCVPGRGPEKQDCLSVRVQSVFPDALIVHRLDMATSGLLLMARGLQSQQNLNRQFEQRSVHKRYLAIAAGKLMDMAPTWRSIDLPIAVDWPQRPLRKIDHLHGKPSLTHWQSIGYDAAAHTTQVILAPVTGRSHQLRVHLQAIGHPILGDALYAPPAIAHASTRLLLHASQIQLQHPQSGHTMRFTCTPPFGHNWPGPEHLLADMAIACA